MEREGKKEREKKKEERESMGVMAERERKEERKEEGKEKNFKVKFTLNSRFPLKSVAWILKHIPLMAFMPALVCI